MGILWDSGWLWDPFVILTHCEAHATLQRLGQSWHRCQTVHTRGHRRCQEKAAGHGEDTVDCFSSSDVVVTLAHLQTEAEQRQFQLMFSPSQEPNSAAAKDLLTCLPFTCHCICGRGYQPAALHSNSTEWPRKANLSSPKICTRPFSVNKCKCAQMCHTWGNKKQMIARRLAALSGGG